MCASTSASASETVYKCHLSERCLLMLIDPAKWNFTLFLLHFHPLFFQHIIIIIQQTIFRYINIYM